MFLQSISFKDKNQFRQIERLFKDLAILKIANSDLFGLPRIYTKHSQMLLQVTPGKLLQIAAHPSKLAFLQKSIKDSCFRFYWFCRYCF